MALGGGGYDAVNVVPRIWAHLLAEAAGHPIGYQSAIPGSWVDHVRAVSGRDPIAVMTDGHVPSPRSWETGYDPDDPDDPVDWAILASRRAAFPWDGLDPWT